MRRGWILLTVSDPAFVRLRMAATTVAAIVLTVVAVVGMATAWGQPVVPAILGVVVAMISSLTVNDPRPRDRAISTALMVPSAAVSAGLAAFDHGHQVLSDAVFVLVMVAAVYLRRWGPRGLAVGMIGFVSYFLALFLQVTPSQLPVMVAGAAVGAAMSFTVRHLLRPRRPDRDLRRELAAWSVRAGRLLDTLGDAVAEGRWSGRTAARVRDRVRACEEAAHAAESRLQGADDPLWSGIANDELAVRVFDAQLTLERVVALSADLVAPAPDEPSDPVHPVDAVEPDAPDPHDTAQRRALRAALGDLRARLGTAVASRRPASERPELAPVLVAALDRCAEAWQRSWSPEPDGEGLAHDVAEAASAEDGPDHAGRADADEEKDDADDEGDDEGEGDDSGGGAPPWRELSRTAAQVAVAGVLAIVLGELLSPVRWFWAVIAAFVVFTGASTREEILTKGWLRVVGTLFGVGAGVVVAALIGGDTVLSLVAIALCVFLGVYLVQVSLAWMIFFITTMLGLLYGLLGQFSVGLLVLRLEETVAGAAAGVLAAYVVLPARGRRAATDDIADVLDGLSELLARVATVVTEPADLHRELAVLEQARTLRDAMTTLRTTARPLTGQVAGLTRRTGLRHLVVVTGACEHHARALARGAAEEPGLVSSPGRRQVVRDAVEAVAGTVATVRPVFEAGGPGTAPTPPSVDDQLEALRRLAEDAEGRAGELLRSVLRHLRAIDGALRGLTRELPHPAAPDQPLARRPTRAGLRSGGPGAEDERPAAVSSAGD
nr:FUSC family protein [Nocardioides panaciterrulae]